MLIAEKPFISVQGEGKYTGTPSLFIRTLGCNLRCSWLNTDGTTTPCDTSYASFPPYEGNKGTVFNIKKTLNILKHTNIKSIVITGGEPLLQPDIEVVVNTFIKEGFNVTVETNGTIFKTLHPDVFMSISPKLTNSYSQLNGNDFKLHRNNNNFIVPVTKYINYLGVDYQLKFVVNTIDDIQEVIKLQKTLKAKNENIYLMPQGIESAQLKQKLPWLIDSCIKNGYKYCNRLHIEIWGNKRGK